MALVLAACAVSGRVPVQEPVQEPVQDMAIPEADAVFRLRHETLIAEQNFPARMYAPQERAQGVARAMPLAARSVVSEAAWESVRAYAEATGSEALIIARRGVIERQAFWGAAADAPQISRSLHKMIVGLLIGRAIHDGFITGLDQSAADFITEWRDTPKAAITIRQLMRMESGLDWYVQSGDPASLFQRAYLHPYSEQIIINDWPLRNTPGAVYDYSNINSELLGLIVQRATGRRYARYLGEALLQPAGAADALVWVNRPGGAPKSGCCLLTTAEAYARIGLWVLDQQKGRGRALLPKGWFKDYLTPGPHKPEFGLAVWRAQPWTEVRRFGREGQKQAGVYHSAPYLDPDLYVFDGADARVMWMSPKADLVILRLGGRPPEGAPRWDNSFIPNMILESLECAS